MPDVTPSAVDYAQLLAEVKERIRCAQYAALKAVNTELVGLYWDLGRLIVEKQEQSGWGKSVVERLSQDLRKEFPGVAGFSVQNLWYMRQFHLEYREHEKLQPLVGEIAWQIRDAGILRELQSGSGRRPATLGFPRLINLAQGREVF